MKIQISSQNKFLAAVIGGSLLILILGQLLLSDLGRRSKNAGQQVRQMEARLAEVSGIQGQGEAIASDFARYQRYLAPERMAPRQVVEELLREIERIARDAGASIINLSPQEIPESTQKPVEYKADLRFECSSDQLLIFFKDVHDSQYLIKIVKFSITPRDEQGLLLKVEMLISLSVG